MGVAGERQSAAGRKTRDIRATGHGSVNAELAGKWGRCFRCARVWSGWLGRSRKTTRERACIRPAAPLAPGLRCARRRGRMGSAATSPGCGAGRWQHACGSSRVCGLDRRGRWAGAAGRSARRGTRKGRAARSARRRRRCKSSCRAHSQWPRARQRRRRGGFG